MLIVSLAHAMCGVAERAHAQQEYAANYFVDFDAGPGGDGSSWPNAFDTLDEALDAAEQDPGVIWVAEGTYVPTVRTNPNDPRSVSFQIPDATLVFGGFEGDEDVVTQREIAVNPTILSGLVVPPSGPPYRAYHVVSFIGTGGQLTRWVDGFIIEQGLADGAIDRNRNGAGMYVDISGGATIANCIFRFNQAEDEGGGLWAATRQLNDVTVVNCIFQENQAGGGGGMAIDVNSVNLEADFVCVNNTFWRNTASNGGGLLIDNADDLFETEHIIVNCSFVENESAFDGGAIAVENDDLGYTVRNCIAWDNSVNNVVSLATQFEPDIPDITVTYSCVVGISETNGNIADDPLFASQSSNNLRLSACSPCIDAADSTVAQRDVLPFDLDLTPRIVDETSTTDTGVGDEENDDVIDMGAYERKPPQVQRRHLPDQ